jgi:type IV pilus assembly protein PilN
MATINLLPWRAERRKQRQKEFLVMLGMTAAFAIVLAFGVVKYFDALIENQNARNSYLQNEIKALDGKIKEIDGLERQRAALLARKEVIEQLQANRSQMVHLFSELVKTLPDGVRLVSIKQAGQLLTLEGVAQSNARVSSYMRSLEKSGWMRNPDLSIIEAKGGDRSMPYQFILRVSLTKPKKEGDDTDSLASTGGMQ